MPRNGDTEERDERKRNMHPALANPAKNFAEATRVMREAAKAGSEAEFNRRLFGLPKRER